jgi:serine phosphatase RsbU (regulator of sigma subunit)/HAMP domain-containing protein
MAGHGRLTLTNRLLMLAAVIVVVTTVLLLATSAVGVYQLAAKQENARRTAYRDIIAAEIRGRLESARRVAEAAAQDPALSSESTAEWRRALSSAVIGDAAYLEGIVLLGPTRERLAVWPGELSMAMLPSALERREGPVTGSVFMWAPNAQSGGSLWVVTPVRGASVGDRVVCALVRTDLIAQTLNDVASSAEGVTAVIVDGDGRTVYSGGDARRIAGRPIVFSPDEERPTRGVLTVDGSPEYVGAYAELAVPAGLGWRVAVLESSETALRETWSALLPGALGWVAALFVALAVSLAAVRRVTQPIGELERRARALASGADVEPEAVDQTDAVGRLLDAFNSVVSRVKRLSELAELLARASDRSLVLKGVTSSIAHTLGAVDIDVLLLAEGNRVQLVAAEGALSSVEDLTIDLDAVPWVAEAVLKRESVAASGTDGDPLLSRHAEDGPLRAVATPLLAGDEVWGVIVVVRPGTTGFSDAELEAVRSFAAQASVALQQSRLFDEERTSRREAEALRSMAERVATPSPVDETLADVARMLADLLGFDDARVVMRERALFGLPGDDNPAAEGEWLSALDEPASGSAATAPVVVNAGDGRALDERLKREGAQGALVVPVMHGSSPAAALVLLSQTHVAPLGGRRLGLVSAAAAQSSLALNNAYLYEQARRRADNLETIFRISHAVGSSLQSRVVLNRVLDVVQKILSADAVMLMTYDAQRKLIRVPMARGILHRDMLDATFRPGEDVPGRVFETREPERFDRISRADTGLLNAAARQGLESLLVVPLLARGRSIGVLAAFSRTEAAFTADDLDLLRTFASQAALAIDTAEMFSREHHVASVLKESIQPTRVPRVPGIETAQVYLPAGAEADIGGDYYDLFTSSDGRVVAAIGDVCGKGVAAATKTSMIKYSVRGMVAAGLEPARIMRELNRMLAATGDATNIVTLWLGYVDLDTMSIVYANGGHPPALLLHAEDGSIERLATTGALLGAVPDADWAQHTVSIAQGDTLLLYTDGVTEARNGARFFGEGRVRRCLRAGGSAEAIVQRLFSMVQRFSAGDVRDDAAILAVVVTPEHAIARRVSGAPTSGK